MKFFKKHSSDRRKLVTMGIVCLGVFLLAVAAKFPSIQFIGLELSNIFTNVGTFFLVIMSMQWLFEEFTREDLVSDLSSRIIGNQNVASCGIVNFVSSTHEIPYTTVFGEPGTIIVGFQYSSRIIDDYIGRLRDRALNGFNTVIIMFKEGGAAQRYLADSRHETRHISAELANVIRKVREANKDLPQDKMISIHQHDVIMRYSFVMTDNGIWVKLYKNSRGTAEVPRFLVQRGSALYDFYRKDVEAFLREASYVST